MNQHCYLRTDSYAVWALHRTSPFQAEDSESRSELSDGRMPERGSLGTKEA